MGSDARLRSSPALTDIGAGRGASAPERVVGRYALFSQIAAGGMATVHLGRVAGAGGFSRVVAVKRMHPQFAKDPAFVRMFLHEAKLTSRVRHPSVVSAIDVVSEDDELFIVMDYVEGESLGRLIKLGDRGAGAGPVPIVVAAMNQALQGLHAAHEARDEAGAPLGIVHRDVSPQNILVGIDGLARVVDFGIAKAAGSEQTKGGVLKGKVAYMSPEQIRTEPMDRRADVYAASVVLWEALTGKRLFVADTSPKLFEKILRGGAAPVSAINADVPPALEAVIAKGLARDREHRFGSALEMADALEHATPTASQRTVGKWVESVARSSLADRAGKVAAMETSSPDAVATHSNPAIGANEDRSDTTVPDVPRARVEARLASTPDAADPLPHTQSVVRPWPAPAAPADPVPAIQHAPPVATPPSGPIEHTRPAIRAPFAPPAAIPLDTHSASRSPAPIVPGPIEDTRAIVRPPPASSMAAPWSVDDAPTALREPEPAADEGVTIAMTGGFDAGAPDTDPALPPTAAAAFAEPAPPIPRRVFPHPRESESRSPSKASLVAIALGVSCAVIGFGIVILSVAAGTRGATSSASVDRGSAFGRASHAPAQGAPSSTNAPGSTTGEPPPLVLGASDTTGAGSALPVESSAPVESGAPVESTAPVETQAPSASAIPSARRPPPSKASQCNPPYYYENGFKRFKPGCLPH